MFGVFFIRGFRVLGIGIELVLFFLLVGKIGVLYFLSRVEVVRVGGIIIEVYICRKEDRFRVLILGL